MLRRLVQASIGIYLLVSLPLLGAEIRFKTMKLPPNVNVHIEGSTARLSGERIETVWNCVCAKDKGSCSIQSNTEALSCYKGAGDTCKTDCFLSIDLGGLLGSPDYRRHARATRVYRRTSLCGVASPRPSHAAR